MKEVKIYSTPVCPYCRRAKALFDELGVQYKDIDLAADEKLRSEMIEKYQWQTVPMIFIGEDFIGGFDELLNLQVENKLQTMLN